MTDYERLFEKALQGNPSGLSEQGAARRAAMKSGLVQAVRRRRRARSTLRTASLLAAAAVLLLVFWPSTPALPQPVDVPGRSAVQIVRSDPDTLTRYTVRNRAPRVEILDDERLLGALERVGHRSGILRAGDRVILTNPLPEPTDE